MLVLSGVADNQLVNAYDGARWVAMSLAEASRRNLSWTSQAAGGLPATPRGGEEVHRVAAAEAAVARGDDRAARAHLDALARLTGRSGDSGSGGGVSTGLPGWAVPAGIVATVAVAVGIYLAKRKRR